jgi:hypothetical protein
MLQPSQGLALYSSLTIDNLFKLFQQPNEQFNKPFPFLGLSSVATLFHGMGFDPHENLKIPPAVIPTL